MCEINCGHYACQDQHKCNVLGGSRRRGGRRSETDDLTRIPHRIHCLWEQIFFFIVCHAALSSAVLLYAMEAFGFEAAFLISHGLYV